MHNDRKTNNRGRDGYKMSKRRIVSRPICKHNLCQCKLILHYDDAGFYLKPGQGNRTHDGHPVLQETGFIHPSKTISTEDRDLCRKIINPHAPVASAITILTESTKRNYNYNQVRYICSLDEAITKKNIQGSMFSAHDKLVLELQERELPYILLKVVSTK